MAQTNGFSHIHPSKETIVVVGTGDLGRALTCCFIRGGYRVVVASRTPERHRSRINAIGAEITNYTKAWNQSSIIVLAIPFEGFQNLPQKDLVGKILVDVSNRPLKYDSKSESLAIVLQNKLPTSRVVKAFNTLSAYALEKGQIQGSKEVPICSNDEEAKAKVITLARRVGFSPVDFGSLTNAKAIEDIPLAFFSDWKFAGILASIFFIIAFLLMLFRRQLCENFGNLNNDKEWDWSLFTKFPLINMHHSFGLTAILMLTSCYAPGVIASYVQLYKQTKYIRFPNWLDRWLKSRKCIGPMALFFAYEHFLLAVMTEIGFGIDMEWRTCLYFFCGVTAFTLMTILGITSLPSVAKSLTWREFSFIHRYLGWNCLFFATCHLLFMKWKELIEDRFVCYFIPDTGQIFIWYPLFTLLFKLPLLIPFVDTRLQKIRRGYEGKKQQARIEA